MNLAGKVTTAFVESFRMPTRPTSHTHHTKIAPAAAAAGSNGLSSYNEALGTHFTNIPTPQTHVIQPKAPSQDRPGRRTTNTSSTTKVSALQSPRRRKSLRPREPPPQYSPSRDRNVSSGSAASHLRDAGVVTFTSSTFRSPSMAHSQRPVSNMTSTFSSSTTASTATAKPKKRVSYRPGPRRWGASDTRSSSNGTAPDNTNYRSQQRHRTGTTAAKRRNNNGRSGTTKVRIHTSLLHQASIDIHACLRAWDAAPKLQRIRFVRECLHAFGTGLQSLTDVAFSAATIGGVSTRRKEALRLHPRAAPTVNDLEKRLGGCSSLVFLRMLSWLRLIYSTETNLVTDLLNAMEMFISATGGNGVLLSEFTNSGGIQAVLAILMHENTAASDHDICLSILARIVCTSREYKQLFCLHGGLSTIMNYIRRHLSPQKKERAAFLKNMLLELGLKNSRYAALLHDEILTSMQIKMQRDAKLLLAQVLYTLIDGALSNHGWDDGIRGTSVGSAMEDDEGDSDGLENAALKDDNDAAVTALSIVHAKVDSVNSESEAKDSVSVDEFLVDGAAVGVHAADIDDAEHKSSGDKDGAVAGEALNAYLDEKRAKEATDAHMTGKLAMQQDDKRSLDSVLFYADDRYVDATISLYSVRDVRIQLLAEKLLVMFAEWCQMAPIIIYRLVQLLQPDMSSSERSAMGRDMVFTATGGGGTVEEMRSAKPLTTRVCAIRALKKLAMLNSAMAATVASPIVVTSLIATVCQVRFRALQLEAAEVLMSLSRSLPHVMHTIKDTFGVATAAAMMTSSSPTHLLVKDSVRAEKILKAIKLKQMLADNERAAAATAAWDDSHGGDGSRYDVSQLKESHEALSALQTAAEHSFESPNRVKRKLLVLSQKKTVAGGQAQQQGTMFGGKGSCSASNENGSVSGIDDGASADGSRPASSLSMATSVAGATSTKSTPAPRTHKTSSRNTFRNFGNDDTLLLTESLKKVSRPNKFRFQWCGPDGEGDDNALLKTAGSGDITTTHILFNFANVQASGKVSFAKQPNVLSEGNGSAVESYMDLFSSNLNQLEQSRDKDRIRSNESRVSTVAQKQVDNRNILGPFVPHMISVAGAAAEGASAEETLVASAPGIDAGRGGSTRAARSRSSASSQKTRKPRGTKHHPRKHGSAKRIRKSSAIRAVAADDADVDEPLVAIGEGQTELSTDEKLRGISEASLRHVSYSEILKVSRNQRNSLSKHGNPHHRFMSAESADAQKSRSRASAIRSSTAGERRKSIVDAVDDGKTVDVLKLALRFAGKTLDPSKWHHSREIMKRNKLDRLEDARQRSLRKMEVLTESDRMAREALSGSIRGGSAMDDEETEDGSRDYLNDAAAVPSSACAVEPVTGVVVETDGGAARGSLGAEAEAKDIMRSSMVKGRVKDASTRKHVETTAGGSGKEVVQEMPQAPVNLLAIESSLLQRIDDSKFYQEQAGKDRETLRKLAGLQRQFRRDSLKDSTTQKLREPSARPSVSEKKAKPRRKSSSRSNRAGAEASAAVPAAAAAASSSFPRQAAVPPPPTSKSGVWPSSSRSSHTVGSSSVPAEPDAASLLRRALLEAENEGPAPAGGKIEQRAYDVASPSLGSSPPVNLILDHNVSDGSGAGPLLYTARAKYYSNERAKLARSLLAPTPTDR